MAKWFDSVKWVDCIPFSSRQNNSWCLWDWCLGKSEAKDEGRGFNGRSGVCECAVFPLSGRDVTVRVCVCVFSWTLYRLAVLSVNSKQNIAVDCFGSWDPTWLQNSFITRTGGLFLRACVSHQKMLFSTIVTISVPSEAPDVIATAVYI